jgi:hypothetical protein
MDIKKGQSFDPSALDLASFVRFSTLSDFEELTSQAKLIQFNLNADDIYSSKGFNDPNGMSPAQIVNNHFQSSLKGAKTTIQQFSTVLASTVIKKEAETTLLTEILTGITNALLGFDSSNVELSATSIIGAIVSYLGAPGLGELVTGLGVPQVNSKRAKVKENETWGVSGKHISTALQGVAESMNSAEGNSRISANVSTSEANVHQINSTVGTNFTTPFMSVAANSHIQTSTDYILLANNYKVNSSFHSTIADNSLSFYTQHSNYYCSKSLNLQAKTADMIVGNLTDYADFRWTQTGQEGGSVTEGLDELRTGLFGESPIALNGVNVDLTKTYRLESARILNMNHGGIYTIDGDFVFINSGLGNFLSSLPLREFPAMPDLTPNQVATRPEPIPPVSVNGNTSETGSYGKNPLPEHNLGQLILGANNRAHQLMEDGK